MRTTWVIGVAFALIFGAVVSGLAYEHLVKLPALPLRNAARVDHRIQQIASPGDTWIASSYLLTEGGLTTLDSGIATVARIAPGAQSRLVYYGPPADIAWRGDGVLVVTEHQSGRVHRIDASTGKFDMRFSTTWNALVSIAFVVVPGAVVVLVVGCTILYVRHRRSREASTSAGPGLP